MPPAKRYLARTMPDLSSADINAIRELETMADREFRERGELWDTNWKYYTGQHKRHLKDDTNNVVVNLCAQAVDFTVTFLVPELPEITLPGEGDSEIEQYLMLLWEENGGATLLSNMVKVGCLAGHVFARVVNVGEGQSPRLFNLHPATIIAYWDDDDRDKVLWYEMRWKAGKESMRQDIVKDPDTGQWTFYDMVKVGGSKYKLIGETPWPLDYPPIVDWPHMRQPGKFYGMHELGHAELNDQLNKIASDISAILRFHAFPKTVGTGFEASTLQETGVDNFWVIPDEHARVENLEMQSDLKSSMDYMNTLMGAFYAQSRVTILNTTPDTFRGMTNLGIRATFMNSIAKNEQLRRTYGKGIEMITMTMAAIKDMFIERPVLEWGEALPMDRREEVQLIQMQQQMGLMSDRTASGVLGLDYDLEQERILDEAEQGSIRDGFNTFGVSDGNQPQLGSGQGNVIDG